MSSCSSSSSSFSSVGYPNWVRGGLVAKLETRRGHKHLRSGYEEEEEGFSRASAGEERRRRLKEEEEEEKRGSENTPMSLSLSLYLPFSLSLSLPLSNERMHERLLQTVESGERVLPWGSLFRAIDFHPPPTISPPNATGDRE